jgi:methionyl-tRNA formyltransferase
MLEKADAQLDFAQPAQAVHDWARGMSPWPGAETVLEGERLKVHRTAVVETDGALGAPGVVLDPSHPLPGGETGLLVACARGALALVELQLEGKRRMKARELLQGRPISAGVRLGAPRTA